MGSLGLEVELKDEHLSPMLTPPLQDFHIEEQVLTGSSVPRSRTQGKQRNRLWHSPSSPLQCGHITEEHGGPNTGSALQDNQSHPTQL